jgi:hypothetical protein
MILPRWPPSSVVLTVQSRRPPMSICISVLKAGSPNVPSSMQIAKGSRAASEIPLLSTPSHLMLMVRALAQKAPEGHMSCKYKRINGAT